MREVWRIEASVRIKVKYGDRNWVCIGKRESSGKLKGEKFGIFRPALESR